MLSTDEFQEFSKKVVPFLSMMTHIEGRKDDDLLKTYGYRGFPSLAFLDAEGNKLMTQGKRSVEGFEESLIKVSEYVELSAKVAAGDKTAVVPALIAQMKLGGIDYAGAQAKAKDATFSKEQRTAFTAALLPLLKTLPFEAAKIEVKNLKLNKEQHAKAVAVLDSLEITDLLKNSRQDRGAAASEAFYKMWKDGRGPKVIDSNPSYSFWNLLLSKARRDSDAKLFEAAWGILRPEISKNPRAAPYVEKQDAKLEELKKGSGDDDGDDDDDDDDDEKKDGEEKK